MKIYKLKDLRSPEYQRHFFEIIESNKIWVSATAKLNDEEEFHFTMDCEPTTRTPILIKRLSMLNGQSELWASAAALVTIKDKRIREIVEPIERDIIKMCREKFGVTSFSMQQPNSYLWKTYGGDGNGAAIEFDLPDNEIGESFHEIEYVNKKSFHVDTFIESQFEKAATQELYATILCTKKDRWKVEKEIRFIGGCTDKNLTFNMPITKVIIGRNASNAIIQRIESICSEKGYAVTRSF